MSPGAAAPVPETPAAAPSADGFGEPESGGESGFHPVDPRFVDLERLTGFIFWGCLAAAAAVGLVILFFVQGWNWIWFLSLGGAAGVLLALAVLFWIWPAIEHRYLGWRLDATGLEIARGVFWRHRISVPLARLQHADISQGPIQRQFGLAKLTVYTAGTAYASVDLNGLAIEVATWLRDQLIQHRGDFDVV